jgi:hypothetical protein
MIVGSEKVWRNIELALTYLSREEGMNFFVDHAYALSHGSLLHGRAGGLTTRVDIGHLEGGFVSFGL